MFFAISGLCSLLSFCGGSPTNGRPILGLAPTNMVGCYVWQGLGVVLSQHLCKGMVELLPGGRDASENERKARSSPQKNKHTKQISKQITLLPPPKKNIYKLKEHIFTRTFGKMRPFILVQCSGSLARARRLHGQRLSWQLPSGAIGSDGVGWGGTKRNLTSVSSKPVEQKLLE